MEAGDRAVSSVAASEKAQAKLEKQMGQVEAEMGKAKAAGDMDGFGHASEELGKLKEEAKLTSKHAALAVEASDEAEAEATRNERNEQIVQNIEGITPPPKVDIKVKQTGNSTVQVTANATDAPGSSAKPAGDAPASAEAKPDEAAPAGDAPAAEEG